MESKLDRAKINSAGEDLITDVQKMYESLGRVKNLIDGSKSYFDSDAGNSLRTKFNTSAEKFDEFKTFLNTYGEFLKTFSGNVQKFEDAVKEAVDGIPNL